mmetsp:Transcript_20604/g.64818  ORF Transcript_20604/g.64818 Transcript_20604/m.64818 type:complete len:453 (+) Transcript_20604:363-1721(+)
MPRRAEKGGAAPRRRVRPHRRDSAAALPPRRRRGDAAEPGPEVRRQPRRQVLRRGGTSRGRRRREAAHARAGLHALARLSGCRRRSGRRARRRARRSERGADHGVLQDREPRGGRRGAPRGAGRRGRAVHEGRGAGAAAQDVGSLRGRRAGGPFLCGDESRRRRGRDVDISARRRPRRKISAPAARILDRIRARVPYRVLRVELAHRHVIAFTKLGEGRAAPPRVVPKAPRRRRDQPRERVPENFRREARERGRVRRGELDGRVPEARRAGLGRTVARRRRPGSRRRGSSASQPRASAAIHQRRIRAAKIRAEARLVAHALETGLVRRDGPRRAEVVRVRVAGGVRGRYVRAVALHDVVEPVHEAELLIGEAGAGRRARPGAPRQIEARGRGDRREDEEGEDAHCLLLDDSSASCTADVLKQGLCSKGFELPLSQPRRVRRCGDRRTTRRRL